MNHRRTTNRTRQPFTIVMLITVLLSAAAPLVHADGTWTNQTSSAAVAPSARYDHAMASLGGDQVLLFGGYNCPDETWVYDLSDNTWTNQTPAAGPSARWSHAMAYIGGDQVLLFGGYDGSDETWVYDLSDNTWTEKTPTTGPSARARHAMARIGADQVLLFGGYDGSDETWVYDLSDNTWTNQAPAASPSARIDHAMAYLGGDQVLLFGGDDAGVGYLGDTWVYDLSDNTWMNQTPAAAPSARRLHAMASLGESQVLLFGGDGGSSGGAWVYDLNANTWTDQAPAARPSVRRQHAMASLGADQVLLFGGEDAGGSDGETWVYDLSANTWTNEFPLADPSKRAKHAMASLGGERVLLFGGDHDGGETWVYDLSNKTWTNQAPVTAPSARYWPVMAYVGEDQVLLFGGYDGSYNNETWVYNLSNNTWTNHAPAVSPSPRFNPAMAPLGGDQALLFGGSYPGVGYYGETWVYDLSTDSWTNQTPAAGPSARVGHAMASLGEGQVLLFGGYDGSNPVGDTWVYDLSANTWTNKAPAGGPSARSGHAMAYLGGDQVLLFGGGDGETWIYDLSNNTWMNRTPAVGPSARHDHAMASLGEGQVLLFGGYDGVSLLGDTWLATGFSHPFRLYLPLVVRSYTPPETEITIWHPWTGDYMQEYQDIIDEFHLAHPGITVQLVYVEDLGNALADSIPAGTGPDLVFSYNDRIGVWALAGFLELLNPWIDLSYLTANFEPAAVEAMIWQEHIWGIPDTQEGIAFVYNRDLISDTQIPAPDDWNVLLTEAAQFRQSHPEQFYLCDQGLGNADAYHVAPIYFGHGLSEYGGYVDEDGTVYMTTTAAISAAHWISDLRPYAPAETSYDICRSMLIDGEAAIWWTGPWAIADLQAAGIDYGIAPTGSPFVGVRTFMMTSNAVDRGHAGAAIDVMKYLGSAEVQRRLTLANHTIPASTAALNDPDVQALYDIARFGASLNLGTPMGNHIYTQCQWGPVGDATTAIWNGTQTPEEAMNAAQIAIEDCVDDMGGYVGERSRPPMH